MTKTEFVAKFSEKTGFNKVDSEKSVNAFLETITETLKSGEKVAFIGFGTFDITEHPARLSRNPQNGEMVEIKATRTPKFKAGKGLKEALA